MRPQFTTRRSHRLQSGCSRNHLLTSCASSCFVPGFIIAFGLSIEHNVFHFFRENLAPVLYALHAAGMHDPARTNSVRLLLMTSGRSPAAVATGPVTRWVALIPYLAALTAHPLLVFPPAMRRGARGHLETVGPAGARPCFRFEKLQIGPLAQTSVNSFEGGSGNYYDHVRASLLAGLRVRPCVATWGRGPRLTLIVRKKVSLARPGRLFTNLEQVLAALAAQLMPPPRLITKHGVSTLPEDPKHALRNQQRGTVRTAILEELPLHMQWQVVSRTDVLVGAHGAGLGNAIFLPRAMWPTNRDPAGDQTGSAWTRRHVHAHRGKPGLPHDAGPVGLLRLQL